jgi:hypothetical protein
LGFSAGFGAFSIWAMFDKFLEIVGMKTTRIAATLHASKITPSVFFVSKHSAVFYFSKKPYLGI